MDKGLTATALLGHRRPPVDKGDKMPPNDPTSFMKGEPKGPNIDQALNITSHSAL